MPTTCTYPEPGRFSPCRLPQSYFLHSHLNIIIPSMSGSYKWPFLLRFSHQNPAYISPIPIRATCSAHIILLDLITLTIFVKEYRSLCSSLCGSPLAPVTSSLLGPNILLNTLFSDNFNLR